MVKEIGHLENGDDPLVKKAGKKQLGMRPDGPGGQGA